MTSLDRSDDNDLLTALRHPLRRRILREMAREEALSPRQLSITLDQPLSNVSYHVRVLAECAAIVLVRTKPVRGSMQHFYCANVEEPWAREVLGLDGGGGGGNGNGGEGREEGGGESPDEPAA